MPLPLSADLVLVPLKMRRPRFEQDGATGYINSRAVKNVEPFRPANPKRKTNTPPGIRCLLYLQGGAILHSYYSKQNTEKRLLNGRLALAHYFSLQSRESRGGNGPVIEQASADALDKVATASRILYELLVDRPNQNLACESVRQEYWPVPVNDETKQQP